MLFILAALALIVAQFALPRHLAFLPILIATFHLGNLPVIGEFTQMRLVIIAGLIRASMSGDLRWSFQNRVDQFVALFSAIALLSSLGHEANIYVPSPFIERVGLVLNVLGAYLYGRAYMTGPDFVTRFATSLAIVLIPFSALVGLEQATGNNYYSSLGARSEFAGARKDRLRAKGPFGHAILAGTAAAASLPFMILLRRRQHKLLGTLGVGASIIATLASASSGPIVAFAVAVGLLAFWRWRHLLGRMKSCAGILLIVLNFTMSRPIWFLIARIDIVGGSTGWHRSKLIDTAMNRLDEWWLAGTDYTRDWMFSGVTWNPNHTDITNHYLQMGVLGGLPLMIAFIAILIAALMGIERALPDLRAAGDEREFEAWCVWTSLLVHSVSFISISYFDQSYGCFFLLIGAVAAIREWEPESLDEEGDLEFDSPSRTTKFPTPVF
jgi:hypothetical protein